MAEVPRKPTFPDHIIRKIISRIQRDVDDDVIPVSTGIYTEEKLIEKLSAIPKPVLQDYDDRIFYEIVEKVGVCTNQCCYSCGIEFSNKCKAVMCHFCAKWRCEECTCHRQRLHPLDSNPNGSRYSICNDCDNKFLLLQLNHPYVENKILVEEAIMAVNKELEDIEDKVQILEQKKNQQLAQPKRKIGIKQSILKKQQLQLSKKIKKAEEGIEEQNARRQKLLRKKKDMEQKAQLFKREAIRKQIERQERQIRERKEQEEKNRQQQAMKDKERVIQNLSSPSSSSQRSSFADEQNSPMCQKIQKQPIQKIKQKSPASQTQSEEEEYWRQNTQQELKGQGQNINEQTQNQFPSTYGNGGATEDDSQQMIKQTAQMANQNKRKSQESDEQPQEQQEEYEFPNKMQDYFKQTEFSHPNYLEDIERERSRKQQQKLAQFRKTLEEPQQDASAIENAKKELLRQAIMRQKKWEEEEQNSGVMADKGEKCKCSLF